MMRKEFVLAAGVLAFGTMLAGNAAAQSCSESENVDCGEISVTAPQEARTHKKFSQTYLDAEGNSFSPDGIVWPPNHKLHTVEITTENEDCTVEIVMVTQDEATDMEGSGATDIDATNCGNAGNSAWVDVRGERSGMGDGRFYHIEYTVTDSDDESCMDEAIVAVPHDRGVKKSFQDQETGLPSGDDCMMEEAAEAAGGVM